MKDEHLEIMALNREIGELQGALTFILASHGNTLTHNTIDAIGGLIQKINKRESHLFMPEKEKQAFSTILDKMK